MCSTTQIIQAINPLNESPQMRATAAFRVLRDHYLLITALSGVILITMGLMLFTGEAPVEIKLKLYIK